ncbi:MAG: hypothetical protein A2X82_11630 [Geobacteraceae bacterium GWC2_55_20]|nr:MAG: hypothetical protein A2X82_11630 [Geobacteraceae bacterium GWC2_55_20]OGU23354.1 MAG: hypothetical protein A2X85_17785 [Geobacteraceae bacterium GWF2_54_21]HCE66864.1 hypothetical protein [Geobacter sp.]
MLRNIFILLAFALLTSAASAEIYKWEDENGIHLTDSPGSVPEKYREKVYADTRAQIKNTAPKATGIANLNIPAVVNQINQVSVFQANLEQQRHKAEALRQQQARTLAVSNKKVKSAFASLAGFMVIWLMLGSFLLIGWIATIVDIVRSEFETPSNKTVWMLLVIFIPLIGMVLYYIFGLGQKCSSISYMDRQREDLQARLSPRDPKDRDFII